MRLHVYRDRKREWRWTLVARNGKRVACSGEGYQRRRNCEAIARTILKDFNPELPKSMASGPATAKHIRAIQRALCEGEAKFRANFAARNRTAR